MSSQRRMLFHHGDSTIPFQISSLHLSWIGHTVCAEGEVKISRPPSRAAHRFAIELPASDETHGFTLNNVPDGS